MATNIQQAYLPSRANLRRVAASWGPFLWHFLQMVLAMEAGMIVYHRLLYPLVLARTPYAALTDIYPLVGYWGMVVSMVLGMLVLMLYQRSTGRYLLEMTAAMVAPIAALTVLVLCSLIPSHVLYGIGDPVMFVAMAVYMLYRPHQHGHGAHQHNGHHAAGSPRADIAEHCVHEAKGAR